MEIKAAASRIFCCTGLIRASVFNPSGFFWEEEGGRIFLHSGEINMRPAILPVSCLFEFNKEMFAREQGIMLPSLSIFPRLFHQAVTTNNFCSPYWRKR